MELPLAAEVSRMSRIWTGVKLVEEGGNDEIVIVASPKRCGGHGQRESGLTSSSG